MHNAWQREEYQARERCAKLVMPRKWTRAFARRHYRHRTRRHSPGQDAGHHLYRKYGNYNKDGYFILSYERWEYYDRNPKAYARVKRNASLWAMVPFVGMVVRELLFNKMGLQTWHKNNS